MNNKAKWDKEEAELIAENGGVKLRHVRGPSPEQIARAKVAKAKRLALAASREIFVSTLVNRYGIDQRAAYELAFFQDSEAMLVCPEKAADTVGTAFRQ